uniref:Putative secreted salivary gland protein n=1 Tax=Ixodes ricinus TaxID=34613 RepID=V5H7L4_IXORI
MFRCVLVLALATCAFAGYLGYGGYSVAAPLSSSYSTVHRAPVVSTLGYGHGLGYGYGLGHGHRLGYGYGLSGYGLWLRLWSRSFWLRRLLLEVIWTSENTESGSAGPALNTT